ncbi:MAG: peptide chain release factor 1 [Nitrospirae bacterium]|uniref:peptide chain release factor 1 n=1 Tax=Candidatus Magnetobacterium casense TaxID=1455061 RepID=UPI000590E76E|nr:peptide chain release factor 1 [Candidatus Magnetobacterium casensis]MBF0337486.1 peptide chain release factor 1 [Nitrospirota bacterium]
MIEKLKTIEDKYNEITQKLSDPGVISSQKDFLRYSKESSELKPLIDKIQEYRKMLCDMEEAEDIIRATTDVDLRELAREEFEELKGKRPVIEDNLKTMLIPKDPRDERNVVIEIRAGTGGDEAALFVTDLFRMYTRYAELRHWKVDVIDSNPTGIGGLKEIVASITGRGAYSRLKYESGVHRVQRVPLTEASGRIHTSASTVAVLPEAEELDLKIDEKDLRIDTFCSSGPGGQGVNTTYSAIRIVHIPTGVTVQCQDERSQLKNKIKAMKVLRSRLYDMEIEKAERQRADTRKSQVGSGDRSERIRTYNFPQNRVTDHRVGLTLHKLTLVLEGDMDEIIDTLSTHFEAKKLQEMAI